MKNQHVVRKSILLIGILLFLANLIGFNYEHLWSRDNLGPVLIMISNLFLIAAMIISLQHTKKRNK